MGAAPRSDGYNEEKTFRTKQASSTAGRWRAAALQEGNYGRQRPRHIGVYVSTLPFDQVLRLFVLGLY
jgi:hypothetical protein